MKKTTLVSKDVDFYQAKNQARNSFETEDALKFLWLLIWEMLKLAFVDFCKASDIIRIDEHQNSYTLICNNYENMLRRVVILYKHKTH